MNSNEPVLCYVREPWAYFTTQELSQQWADDWNDAPYEHNAGRPYEPVWHNLPDHVKERNGELCACSSCLRDWTPDGQPRWEIITVAFEGPFDEPNEGHLNSPYSVQDINRGVIPWLRPSRWSAKNHDISIMAGTTLVEFCELVTRAGGNVYMTREVMEQYDD